MPRLVDPDSFGFLLADITRMFRLELGKRITASGLGVTAGEARVLSHAARLGAVRQNVLAEHLGIEAMTLSGYIDRLEAGGLLRRSIDPADRRARLVELMPAAETVLAAIRPIAAELRDQASRTIPPEQWAHLLATLKTTRANFEELRASANREPASDAA